MEVEEKWGRGFGLEEGGEGGEWGGGGVEVSALDNLRKVGGGSVLGKKSIILFIHNIYTSSARQEPVENPKQSRARDFPHLPPNQTVPLPRRRRLLLHTLPKHFCVFSGKICCIKTTTPRDLMQRDDSTERFVRWPWILLRW
ncbi:uncharacterized protein G2W53_015135 [Senna tora]|uniref:Uncharacterized protein n=1 Tax=Senna tora TaxID=362788 RepID=A0A835C9A1_9FABA|nr:uncharacterized protein G2W53_015135 [Senna tora]